jgi:SET domain-containing protein
VTDKKVYAKESGIHGLGLFAKDHIAEGEVIGDIDPVPVKEDGPHVLWTGDGDAYKVDGLMKYINHSKQPNACYYDDLSVVALCEILPGDEITHDYGDEW